MDKEINLHRLRLVIRGALDYLNRDGGDINEALTAQGKVKLNLTMETIETALLWMRRMVEDALNDDEKEKVIDMENSFIVYKSKQMDDELTKNFGNKDMIVLQ